MYRLIALTASMVGTILATGLGLYVFQRFRKVEIIG